MDESSVSVDAHHLLVHYRVPCAGSSSGLTQQAVVATQALVGELFALPVERSPVGPIAALPAPSTALPRAKPVPEAQAETRWQKFAKDKGILNKKKSRMEWDEERDKWAPSWGYDRAGSALDDAPIIEVKAGDDIMADPWAARKAEKKGRVDANEKKRKKNEERATRARNGGRAPDAPPAGVPVDMGAAKKHKGADHLAQTLKRAQTATASLGNFDAMVDGEKKRDLHAAVKGRKRKFVSSTPAAGTDASRGMELLRDLERPRAVKPKKGQAEVQDTHDGERPNSSDGFKKKKGRAAAGKMKKITKARAR